MKKNLNLSFHLQFRNPETHEQTPISSSTATARSGHLPRYHRGRTRVFCSSLALRGFSQNARHGRNMWMA